VASKKPTSFRLTDEALEILDSWAAELGISKAAIIEMAIREWARRDARKLLEKQVS
jgi:predicted DNA-binding protein